MKLRSFDIKDFGVIVRQKADVDANVFGVTGFNGKGKSTILKAIRYGVTDEIEDKKSGDLASYINDESVDGIARVELNFDSPQGDKVNIVRIIKSTGTERLLTINNDKPIKASKEVESKLASMFGADPKTLSKVVFSPQGALATLLSATPSEREKLFMRVMDSDYMRSSSVFVKGRALQLRESLTDYQPLVTEAKLNLEQKEKELSALESKLNDLSKHDWETFEKTIQSIINIKNTINDTLVDLSSKSARKGQLEESLKELREMVDKYDLKALNQTKATLIKYKENQERAKLSAELSGQLSLQKDILREKEKKLGSIVPPSLYLWDNFVEKFIKEKDAITPTMASVQMVERFFTCCIKYNEILGKINDSKKLAFQMEEVLPGLRENLKKYRQIVFELRSAKQFRNNHSLSSEKCWLCESKITHSVEWNELNEMELKDNEKILDELTHREQMFSGTLGKELHSITWNESNLKAYKDDLQKVNAVDGDSILPEFQDALQPILEQITIYLAYEKIYNQYHREFETQFDLTNNLAQRIKDTGIVSGEKPPVVENLDEQLQEVETQLENYTIKLNRLNLCSSNLHSINERVNELHVSLETAFHKTQELYSTLPNDFSRNEKEIQNLHEQIREKSYDLRATKADMSVAKSAITQYKAQVAKYEALLAKTLHKQVFIGNLTRAADALDKIPKEYVKRQFAAIAVEVANTLASMDAMFEIRPSAHVPLTFEFKNFKNGSTWKPQDKLSGGEGVRLSLAFLIAVQKALLPDIGFMVLDEPSLHLDPEGKRQLSELLGRLGDTVFSGNSQIIVGDYETKTLEYCGQILDLNE